MRRLTSACMAAAFVVAVSPAQAPLTQYSGSIYYDLKDRYTAAVVLTNVSSLTLHGKRLLDVSALAGVRNGDSRPLAGLAFGRSWQVFDQVSVTVAVAGVQPQGARLSAGLVIGLSYRF